MDRGRLDFDFVPVNLLVDFRPLDLWDNRLVCFEAPGSCWFCFSSRRARASCPCPAGVGLEQAAQGIRGGGRRSHPLPLPPQELGAEGRVARQPEVTPPGRGPSVLACSWGRAAWLLSVYLFF